MLDYMWLLVCAFLVFLMQAGFLCLESGRIRSKNSINVAAKNIADFAVSTSVFWLFGFAFMFGNSWSGLFGFDGFIYGQNASAAEISFYLFQMMFCGTAATLTSGAVAERMTFFGYLAVTVILSAAIYPIVGHWVWNSAFIGNASEGWLEGLGFIDFAGATVVHSVGGWVALAAIMIIGPRAGRFENGLRLPPGNNLPLSVLGTLLIWFGWFGFNGGSTLQLTEQVPMILLNTCLSASWAGMVAVGLKYRQDKYIDVGFAINGTIAGLVGITAACHIVSPGYAVIIGIVAGAILHFGSHLMERWRLDDALDVVPAHLFAGIWGTLAVALFGDLSGFDAGTTRVEQLFVQLLGITSIGLYGFVVSYFLLKKLHQWWPLRVSALQEEQGLNVAEHHATTELFDLLTSMEKQQKHADFSYSVPEEPFTEVGQIAHQYNEVIRRVNAEIAQRDNALDQFRTSEMRKSAILDSSMDSIISINREGVIIEFNPAAERTFGCLKRQILGKDFIDSFVIPEEREKIRQSLQYEFLTSQGLVINRRNSIRLQRGPHHHFPAEVTITRTRSELDNLKEYTLHVRDVTRHAKLQERLRFLAYSDPLTGLFNRTYLMDRLIKNLAYAVKDQTSTSLLFLDLDKFKNINDTLGHKAGDELLCEVARRLNSVAQPSDVIARWGGDEFIMLMTASMTKAQMLMRAEQILEKMRAPIILQEQSVTVPTSIGVAVSEASLPIDAERLIQQADIAMYWAKQHGRDNVKFFEESMAQEVTKAFGYQQEMKDALLAQQFSLVYQPKIDVEAQVIIGLEALIRWHHPTKGWIPPSDFIPIAEESNLINKIGEWVINEVLQQVQQWQQLGIQHGPISVNISGNHLISIGFVEFIAEKLALTGVSGECLEIEVTEGVLLQDTDACIAVMTALKSLGIRLSIDDFGTGYSSLNYLRRLPIDILKIDQSFVRCCDASLEDSQICDTIIQLANNLGLMTVAEGVETQAQSQALLASGCKVHQGYYFYRPMDVSATTEILRQHTRLQQSLTSTALLPPI